MEPVKTILVYNIGFERGKLNDLIEVFPEYSNELRGIVNRLKDLMIPFQQKWYYTPEMKGSYSIKYVLPALVPENTYTINTIMEKVSRSFSHFREAAGIETPFTLKHLRKTYLTWVFHTMGSDTRLLSSHTSMKVLENHYINPLLLNVEEEKLMKIKVFG